MAYTLVSEYGAISDTSYVTHTVRIEADNIYTFIFKGF